MKIAEDSRLKLEEFFREITRDEQFRLPAIRFYAGKFSAVLTLLLKIHGITIGGSIFIKPRFVERNADKRRKINVELAAHEIAHVVQFKRDGYVRFFYKYLSSFLKNLREQKSLDAVSRQRAYLEIPYEIEAREAAAEFVEWNRNNGKRKMDNG